MFQKGRAKLCVYINQMISNEISHMNLGTIRKS
jgi:hypothetical protein